MKRSPIAKRSMSPAAVLRRKLDGQFQEKVCRMGQCEICGSRYNVSGHHIVPKPRCNGRLKHLRHSAKNGICLCQSCHVPWAHGDPKQFMVWLKRNRPARHDWLVKEGGIVE